MCKLFPINCPYYLSNYAPRIKKASLKQNIKKTYLEIAAIKSKLVCVKNQLKQSVSTELHHKIMSIFDDNNRCIKFSKKRRLIEKFQWLTRSRITKRTDNDTQEDQVGPIEEPPENRVIAMQVDLSDNEVQLLSLGPNYAIAPRVDDNLIREVKTSMASYAY